MKNQKVITLITPFSLDLQNQELIIQHPLLDTYLQDKYKIINFSQSTLSLLGSTQLIATTFVLEEIISFSY